MIKDKYEFFTNISSISCNPGTPFFSSGSGAQPLVVLAHGCH
jgi:hypothetical protein